MSASSSENGIAWVVAERAAPLAAYPHMREVNGFLFVSGISARRPDHSVEGVDETGRADIRAQTRAVIENLRAVLSAAGARLENLVSITAYLVAMDEYSDYNEVYDEYFTAESGPARTTVGVASLPGPHLLIEMAAVARAPARTLPRPVTLPSRLQPLADRLWDAQRTHTPCQALSETDPELTVEDAYDIQRANVERTGRRIVGRKIGLTSAAVQGWLGVDEPDFGVLTDDMAIGDGQHAPFERLLQPRVEGEIAFLLRRDLRGTGITAADVVGATECILPAIEVIDSRVIDWNIKLVDTIADNASSAMYVLGLQGCRPTRRDLRRIGMTLRKNGEVASTGAGAACLENPVNAVVWLANRLAALGDRLRAGDVILSGALGPVSPVAQGDFVELEIDRLGRAAVRF